MTPLQFVREECANHELDGSCLGGMIEADLSMIRRAPKTRCLIAEGNRFRYFEERVMPMSGTYLIPPGDSPADGPKPSLHWKPGSSAMELACP